VVSKKFFTGLFLISLFFILTGLLITKLLEVPLKLDDLLILTLSFSSVNAIAGFIFLAGLRKDASGRTMHMMVSSSAKLILEMVLALIWFVVVKKTYLPSILLFFVLYLAFSLYSVFFMLNTLKSKPL